MAKEIERRFLLSGIPCFPIAVKSKHIVQGYFDTANPAEPMRVRLFEDLGKAYVTFKEGTGLIREETPEESPYEIDPRLGKKMINIASHSLNKVRFPCDRWEIDIFQGHLWGIVLAEKELSAPDEPLDIPDWLKPVMVCEVTDSISSFHLARLASDLRGTDLSAVLQLESHLRKIRKIVITGGPCSGKSTIMGALKEEFPNFHFVPEVATIVMGQLRVFPGDNSLSRRRFQKTIYRVGKLFEATSIQYAISKGIHTAVFDRGPLDGAAYVNGGVGEFEELIGTTRNGEYKSCDHVIYLSVPPRDIYELNKNNNPERTESYEQACELGKRIYEVWKDHPSFHVSDSEVWEEKVQVVRELLKQ